MKSKIIIATIAITASAAGGLVNKVYEESKSASQKVGKRMIAFNPQSFGSHWSGSSILGRQSHTRGFEAYVVSEGDQIPDNFEVVEDRLYTIDFITGCAEKPTPVPTIPVPAPTFPPDPPSTEVVPWGVERVQAIEAQEIADGSTVLVCIIDTGTDYNHPDLASMLVGGTSHIPGNSSWMDDMGHGTHVAGTVAAQVNTRGVVGVSQAKIFTAKVLDRNGSGYGSWIADGIVSCVNNGASVISASLGSARQYGPDPLISSAVGWAIARGVSFVAAAGNDGQGVGYPAALAGVIGVAASNRSDGLAYFSSRGPEIDIIAPGVDILSTLMGGGHGTMSGTSMATPHVAAACAMGIAAGRGCNLKGDNVGLPVEHQGPIGRLNVLTTVGSK